MAFAYNAPTLRHRFGLDGEDSEESDTFFDVETDDPPKAKVTCENKENDEPNVVSPAQVVNQDIEQKTSRRMSIAKRRINATPGVLQDQLSANLSRLSVKSKLQFEGVSLNSSIEKKHLMTTRQDEASKTMKLRPRESLKRKSNFMETSQPKYVAMAERILHFQADTPPRFRTSKHRSSGGRKSMLSARKEYNPRRTIAVTPKLRTAARARYSHVVSTKEKEEIEAEEMKKHQIKAVPLNEKIFHPPKLRQCSLLPTTVPQPFRLTEVFKKPAAPAEEPYVFKAHPVPKAILEKPTGIGPKQELPVTVPQSPAIKKPKRFEKPMRLQAISNDYQVGEEEMHSFGVSYLKSQRKTEVKPFSFEERDKKMIEKREKKIQEILKAEKKAREFKANPLPSYSVHKDINQSIRSTHTDCAKSPVNEEGHQGFKARSPRVLRKPKFEPQLKHVHTQPKNVQLWTEQRIHERHNFELQQMDKQDRLACLKEMVEMQKKRKEEEAISKLRRDIVHKAQPMPKFKTPPKKNSSNLPLTKPMSPRFSQRSRANLPCTKTKSD